MRILIPWVDYNYYYHCDGGPPTCRSTSLDDDDEAEDLIHEPPSTEDEAVCLSEWKLILIPNMYKRLIPPHPPA